MPPDTGILETLAAAVRRIEASTAATPAALLAMQQELAEMRQAIINWRVADPPVAPRVTATGTAFDSIDEDDIVAGGKTIILTLTDDTWVASGGTFNAQRQPIIDKLVSGGSEANGWNAERSNLPVTDVVRTSANVVTITFSALANHDITAQEVVASGAPAAALVTSGDDLDAAQSFTIQPVIAVGYDDFDDFESYADTAALGVAYFLQEQWGDNENTLSTEQAHSGTQSVKCDGFSNPSSPPAGKAAIVMDEVTWGFTLDEGTIIRLETWFYVPDVAGGGPADGEWPKNKIITFEDKSTGDGPVFKITGSTGQWRIDRGQYGMSNITPPGQSAIPVEQWVKIQIRLLMGRIPTDDEGTYPGAGTDFYTFDADDAGWLQIIQDDVLIAEYSCTTMVIGDTFNVTIGFDSVSEDAVIYIDDRTLQTVSGPWTP